MLAVQRQRKDRLISGQNRSRAITLMHIEINDGNPCNMPFGLHQSGRNRRVVEHAKTLTPV